MKHDAAPLALSLLVLAALTAWTPDAGAIELQVTTIRAADEGKCDPELRRWRPRLRKVAGYQSYQMIGRESRESDWRSTEEFHLPGGQSLQLRPRGMSNGNVVMHIRLLDGQQRLVDTSVRLPLESTMVVGVGRDARLDDEATLILLRAAP
jgi:hypothetical protein